MSREDLPSNDLPEELRDLPQAIDPPPELEDRVVGALRREGLVGGHRSPRGNPWLVAAACLLAAVGGWMARGLVATPEGGPETVALAEGHDYLLLLTEPTPLATDRPESELVAEYRDWAIGLAEQGKLVAAAKLDDESDGRYLGETAAVPVGTVSGYFVIRGTSLEEVTALAAGSPHRRYGGEIAVREIEETDG